MYSFVIRHPFLSEGCRYFLVEVLKIKVLFGQELACAEGSRRIKSESNGSSVGYVLAIRLIESFIRTQARHRCANIDR